MPGRRTLPATSTVTRPPAATGDPDGAASVASDTSPSGRSARASAAGAVGCPGSARTTHHAVTASPSATSTATTARCAGPSATRPRSVSGTTAAGPGRRAACRPGVGTIGGSGSGVGDHLQRRPRLRDPGVALPPVAARGRGHRGLAPGGGHVGRQLGEPAGHGLLVLGTRSSGSHAATLGSGADRSRRRSRRTPVDDTGCRPVAVEG